MRTLSEGRTSLFSEEYCTLNKMSVPTHWTRLGVAEALIRLGIFKELGDVLVLEPSVAAFRPVN